MRDNLFNDLSKLKRLGKNCIIGKTVRIRRPELVEIGSGSIIDDFTYISTGLKMGKYSHIGAGTHIIGGKSGHVEIGDFVNIAPSCQIISGQHNYHGGGLMGPTIPTKYCAKGELSPIKMGHHTLLGCGTVVLPGVTIPEGMVTGAYALLKKREYSPWTIYVGPNAREIGKRDSTEIKRKAKEMMNDPEYWI